jgi:hypothetical protein
VFLEVPINIPMGSIAPPQAYGFNGVSFDDDPHETFGVFIVTHSGII